MVLDGPGNRYLAALAAGGGAADADRAAFEGFIGKLEAACKARHEGQRTLGASVGLSDLTVWAGLYAAWGSRGVVPAEEQDRYPGVSDWFAGVSDLKCCRDAVRKIKLRTPSGLLPPLPPKDASGEKFYITTAINYTNGNPHMGHAYEAVTSDIIARWHRAYGRDVFFCTGTDEHGQKIAQTAEAMGLKPIDICDKYAEAFQVLNRRMDISNDFYIRTTMDKHKKAAQELFRRAADAGDIYLDTYEGWYNVREETFVTENDAQQSDYKDPTSGVPLQKMTEESYFFRMSKYQERLVRHIEDNEDFIQPDYRRNEMLSRLKEPLRDLSVSRTTFDWGVPVPEHPALKSDKKHVMYVWFDALTNYLSAADYPDGPNMRYWPCDMHLIGKDIIWFHTVIWPTMHMSAGVPLPKCVYAHGFINDREGKKMSKSLGNVIDPHEQLDRYSCDTFRCYLAYASPFGADVPFSEEAMVTMHNAELADALGNLVHRATNLAQKYCGGAVPDVAPEQAFDLVRLTHDVSGAMEGFCIQDALQLSLGAVKATNKYLSDCAPWHIKASEGFPEDQAALKRSVVVRTALESLYILAHFLCPFIHNGCAKIFEKLGTQPRPIPRLSPAFTNLAAGSPVHVGEVLYAKLEKKAEAVEEIFPCDMRVGTIKEVKEHPEQDTLFVCQVSLGGQGLRQVCAGLRGKYEAPELVGRSVVLLLNLKPAEFKGVKSEGMLLVGDQQKPQKVQGLLKAGDGSVADGTAVECEGAKTLVTDNMDLKIFQKLELKVLGDGLSVTYKKTMALKAGGQEVRAERVKPGSNVR
uniref:methionine--tRNA ligase n=1 Tax=Hemiselmis tepida TaxID=464990 RepID=A0A7S0VMT7_9CRYP